MAQDIRKKETFAFACPCSLIVAALREILSLSEKANPKLSITTYHPP
jgi:hypothetical protein